MSLVENAVNVMEYTMLIMKVHINLQQNKTRNKYYLNSAKYLKVGQNLWVDRIFSAAVVTGVYSFHASTSAFAEFWNETFQTKVSRRQVMAHICSGTIRKVAQASNTALET